LPYIERHIFIPVAGDEDQNDHFCPIYRGTAFGLELTYTIEGIFHDYGRGTVATDSIFTDYGGAF